MTSDTRPGTRLCIDLGLKYRAHTPNPRPAQSALKFENFGGLWTHGLWANFALLRNTHRSVWPRQLRHVPGHGAQPRCDLRVISSPWPRAKACHGCARWIIAVAKLGSETALNCGEIRTFTLLTFHAAAHDSVAQRGTRMSAGLAVAPSLFP